MKRETSTEREKEFKRHKCKGKLKRKEKRKMGWAYLEVRKKTEELRSKIRVGESNDTDNGEMEKGKAKRDQRFLPWKVREN